MFFATALGAAVPAAAGGVLDDGLPEIALGGGLTVQPLGRVLFDVGHVETPEGLGDVGLGWQDEFRAARLGLQVEHASGIGAKVELDFSDNYPLFTDAFLFAEIGDHVTVRLGQQKTPDSLEELTSGRFTSFLERAAFTDAFGFERRVGGSVDYLSGPLLVQGGIYTGNLDTFSDQVDTPLSFDGRVVLMPEMAGGQTLHLGASLHYRELERDPGALTRYRQRPQFHATDTRLISTTRFDVDSETTYGAEAAWISGPLHLAGEVHWLETGNDVDGPNAGFFGGYAEAGFFLTGESRGYKPGRFDRTKPAKPLGQGGFGAVQVNLRYDHLDLQDDAVGGGSQDAILGSLVWIPTARTRVVLNGGWLNYDNATLPDASGSRDYNVGMIALRTQLDF